MEPSVTPVMVAVLPLAVTPVADALKVMLLAS
jgi:hypothetical protein